MKLFFIIFYFSLCLPLITSSTSIAGSIMNPFSVYQWFSGFSFFHDSSQFTMFTHIGGRRVSGKRVHGAKKVHGWKVSGQKVSGNAVNGKSVNGTAVSGEAVSGQSVSGQKVSGKGLQQNKNTVGVIIGLIYKDGNGNGIQDIDDPGIPLVKVKIVDSNGHTRTVSTNSIGNYTLTLPAGIVTLDVVENTLPRGSTQTQGMDVSRIMIPHGSTAFCTNGYKPLKDNDDGSRAGIAYGGNNGN